MLAKWEIAIIVSTLLSILGLSVYGLIRVMHSDVSIDRCHLVVDPFAVQRTNVVGVIDWRPDVVIGTFNKYEDAEAAMARYAACNKAK